MAFVFALIGKVLLGLLFCAAVILALAILVLLLILFVPIRYRLCVDGNGKWQVNAGASWLFSLFSVKISYQESLDFQIRLAGRDILKGRKRRKKRKENRAKKKKNAQKKKRTGRREKSTTAADKKSGKKKTGEGVSKKAGKKEEECLRENADAQSADKKNLARQPSAGKEMTDFGSDGKKDAAKESEEKKLSADDGEKQNGRFVCFCAKVFRLIRNCLTLPKKFTQLFARAKDLFGRLKKKTDWLFLVKRFLAKENTKKTVRIFKENLARLWKRAKPKKLRANFVIGTSDPCTTGELSTAIACFTALFGDNIKFTPNFAEAELSGTLFLRGRIRLFFVALAALRIFTSREWKRFWRGIKHLRKAM